MLELELTVWALRLASMLDAVVMFQLKQMLTFAKWLRAHASTFPCVHTNGGISYYHASTLAIGDPDGVGVVICSEGCRLCSGAGEPFSVELGAAWDSEAELEFELTNGTGGTLGSCDSGTGTFIDTDSIPLGLPEISEYNIALKFH